MDNDYLSVKDLMEVLHVSRATAYRLVEHLPVFRIGRSIRISRKDLDQFLRTNRSVSTKPRPKEQQAARSEKINKRFTGNLQAILSKQHKTADQLANSTGIEKDRIAAIYNGAEPTLSEAVVIAAATRGNIEDFFNQEKQ